MKHRFAFAGFRHPHILSLWEKVFTHPDCEIVGACESDSNTRRELQRANRVDVTHEDFEEMLGGTGCDIVAIGDVYAKRGEMCIRALEAGCHVISDKPICTKMEEWERIAALARNKNLSVGCQLDLGEAACMRQMYGLVRENILGKICTVTISAQHPLRLETRHQWYFEAGAHGGTINDIGVHVFDLVAWLVGKPWSQLLSARQWNAKAEAVPHFLDCAQVHGTLQDNISCFADVSYLAPNSIGYELPQYWRVTVHGTKGMAETNFPKNQVALVLDDYKEPRYFAAEGMLAGGYLHDFLAEIEGCPIEGGITTERALLASRLALAAQQIADYGTTSNISLS